MMRLFKEFFLLPYKILEPVKHILLNLDRYILFGTKRKKFAFIAVHVGKFQPLFAFDDLNIELRCNLGDDRSRYTRGDEHIE